jgi:hypothetical protein
LSVDCINNSHYHPHHDHVHHFLIVMSFRFYHLYDILYVNDLLLLQLYILIIRFRIQLYNHFRIRHIGGPNFDTNGLYSCNGYYLVPSLDIVDVAAIDHTYCGIEDLV